MSSRLCDSSASLRPTRALLHPLWLGSLAVLVLNDHVLKGASILPSVVTGKLSDFAGLIVAPVLLAALLRVRTQRGWIGAHVAVGLGFSAIQLSAVAAAQWSAAMEAVGFPWFITRDVTDLVALPALLLSAWVLRGAMRRPATSSARHSAELVAAGTGLVCCAATSPAPGEPFIPDLWTDVYVHNAGSEPVVVRIRSLAASVDIDCNAVAEDPGRLLTEPLFGNSRSFLLEPDQNFGLVRNNQWGEEGLWDPETGEPIEHGCNAILLDVDGMPSAVAFWGPGDVPNHTVPGYGSESDPRGRIEIHPSETGDAFGEFETVGGDEVLYLVAPGGPPSGDVCAPQSDAGRLEWSEPLPEGFWELLAVDRGADGCFALDLGTRDTEGEVASSFRWYLCAPLTDLGLDVGRVLDISRIGQSGDVGGVVITTVDADDPMRPQPYVQLQAYRGFGFPPFNGLSVAAVPEFDCEYVVGESCGTVVRATSVTAGGGPFEVVQLDPGARMTLAGDSGSEMTVALAHAEDRAVLDPECAEGPDTLGLDLEVVALYVAP